MLLPCIMLFLVPATVLFPDCCSMLVCPLKCAAGAPKWAPAMVTLHQLRLLTEAGLVDYASKGTRNIFRLNPNGFAAARSYLDGFWDEALANFQRLAASTQPHH